MKKVSVIICSILLSVTILVNPASAHVLKTSGTIGAVLHIEPDDNPTAGATTTYQLAFADTAHNFMLSGCDCQVSVRLNGVTIDSNQLIASSPLISTNTYTFEKPGVYTLNVKGTPKPNAIFNPFSLSYEVRVLSNKQLDAQPFPITLGVGFALMVVLLLLVAVKADGMLEETK